MKISFGMIFSIILIIVFIAFAGYAIVKFINMQQTIQIETFKNDLQNDVNAMWESEGSQTVEYYLPKKITAVCFDEGNRLYFEGENILDEKNIDHVEVVDGCWENIDGRVGMTLVKA